MAVPTVEELLIPMLRLIAGGKEHMADCLPALVVELRLSKEDAEALTPSRRETLLSNRAHWARNSLLHSDLVEAHSRGRYKITEDGRRLLDSGVTSLTYEALKQFPAWNAFLERIKLRDANRAQSRKTIAEGRQTPGSGQDSSPESNPEEAMKAAHDLLSGSLRDELLLRLTQINPIRFERLILDLLSAMGFGGGDLSRTEMTQVTGDGGIDGIIHEDALGLDRVYLQAKRYAPGNNVGSPAIYQFAGSLTARGAAKGVFVTTSDFTKEARAVAKSINQHRIVLIDGQELARLMIRYGVGVRSRTTFVVSGIDEDYFSET